MKHSLRVLTAMWSHTRCALSRKPGGRFHIAEEVIVADDAEPATARGPDLEFFSEDCPDSAVINVKKTATLRNNTDD